MLDVLTVPWRGARRGAILDALGRSPGGPARPRQRLRDRSPASSSSSRAGRCCRDGPIRPATAALADEGPDPETELRARLLVYRAHRDAGLRWPRSRWCGRAVPARARGRTRRGVAGSADGCPPSTANRLVRALDRLAAIAPPPQPRPGHGSHDHDRGARRLIRSALRDAPAVVLQELLEGVRDRVVIAITFLAMLELMKRREIVVVQAEPWGPIVARATTSEERRPPGDAEVVDVPIDETLESFA